MKKISRSHHKILAINEALVLGSVRQHELTEAAENLNTRLQIEILTRTRVQDKLRHNEVFFSALIRQAPVGICVVDAKFRLQQVNPHGMPFFQNVYPLIRRNFSEIINNIWPRRAADQIIEPFRETLKTGKSYQAPVFAGRRRAGGQKEYYEWQIKRVTLPDGGHGVICFFDNITERIHAENAQRRLDILTASNRKLEQEIIERQKVQESLKRSEQCQSRLLERSDHMQARLRHLSQSILQAQEDERKRISRELHDVVYQNLAGINVQLAALKKSATVNTNDLYRKIARAQRLMEKALDIVHNFARELRPTVLDDLGLIPALHSFLKLFSRRTKIHVHLTVFKEVEALNISKKTVLYRVAQEALTNVSRHAHATRVEINIKKLTDDVFMKINDNGKSFQVERISKSFGKKRLGLLGMRERVEMVGGNFNIESAYGKGTTIDIRIPR